jgi:hypothetical protein
MMPKKLVVHEISCYRTQTVYSVYCVIMMYRGCTMYVLCQKIYNLFVRALEKNRKTDIQRAFAASASKFLLTIYVYLHVQHKQT